MISSNMGSACGNFFMRFLRHSATTCTGRQIVQPDGQSHYVFYDAQNRLALKLDAMGFVTQFCYDDRGHVQHQIQYAKAVDISALLNASCADVIAMLDSSPHRRTWGIQQ